MDCVEFYRWFQQNFTKCFHLNPFWSVKDWFFEKNSKMYRFFDRFFRVKLGPTEQHNQKFFLKNAIKHQFSGSAKALGEPPRISLNNTERRRNQFLLYTNQVAIFAVKNVLWKNWKKSVLFRSSYVKKEEFFLLLVLFSLCENQLVTRVFKRLDEQLPFRNQILIGKYYVSD